MKNRVISGESYINSNIVYKKRKGKNASFAFSLLAFGAAVYLISTLLFKAAFGEFVPISAFLFSF